MNSHVRKINQNLVIGWLVIVLVLFVSYLGEVIKGERTIGYLLIFMVATALPALLCMVLYVLRPDWKNLRYFIVCGYFVMYVFSMLTGSTTMVFSYILPMLSLLVLYHMPNLILVTGIASVIVNLISIGIRFLNGQITVNNSKDIEIQLALLFLCFAGSFLATRLYDSITRQNEEYVQKLDEQNVQLQKMTLQAITTIANTIDAKDEYTQGHSRRVSEYSAAIAAELGFAEQEVQDVRSIALLHDIGKIGVPDSVLNKPGRLTDEEYKLMKQHPVIGSEILKDIGMLPGIDVGARYHHERYDGKGYPEGLKGEEIPYIARIIAVADAYDAMTSNRVYREHLNQEYVLKELKNGLGTQFDPSVAQVVIRMIEEGRMVNFSPDYEDSVAAEDDEAIKKATTILSRVMEKREEQFSGKMQRDELTGIYNRSTGEKLIKESMEQGKGCLILVDLDHFRRLNDSSGFVSGDISLKLVAERMENMSEHVIVSRFGGDEFAAYIPDLTTEAEISEKLNQLMTEIDCQVAEWDELDNLTMSAGIAVTAHERETFTELMLRADKALYMAKQKGGNRYCFHHHNTDVLQSKNLSRIDLDRLVAMIKADGHYEGGFQVAYPAFGKIYKLIKKVADRNNQEVQLIMFTVEQAEGVTISIEELDKVMMYLERAILGSVRGVDVATKYSSKQWILVLLGTNQDQIRIVTERVMKEFYKMYDKKKVSVYYDVADLSEQ